MSVVVEPTIPYSPSVLDLENPRRWNTLLPLIRPTVVPAQTVQGHKLLVDSSHASSQSVSIAVIAKPGNLSSKLLDDKYVTAIITKQQGAGLIAAKQIAGAIQQAGVRSSPGMVLLQSGGQDRVDLHDEDILEVETKGELELDHLLHLLGNATASCRASIHLTAELVKTFLRDVSTTRSKFDTKKDASNPAVMHHDGSKAFEKAKTAIERDLKHVMKSQTAQHESVVYSVHYSDFNGLSRLENYIFAAEIGQLMGKIFMAITQ